MPRRIIGVMAVTCLLATSMLASAGVAQAAVVRPLETMCSTATVNFYYHNSYGDGATVTFTARACTNGSRAYGTSLLFGLLTLGVPGYTYGYNNPGGGSTTEFWANVDILFSSASMHLHPRAQFAPGGYWSCYDAGSTGYPTPTFEGCSIQ